MAQTILIPAWFFPYHHVFQFIFFALTFIVGSYAIKISKTFDNKQIKLFGISFLLFSLHYLIQAIINTIMPFTTYAYTIYIYGIYAHMFIFITGLVTLIYAIYYMKRKEIYFLLILMSLTSIFFSINKIYIFYFLSSILLIFISVKYLENFLKNKQKITLLPLTAFILLLFGNIHFLFSMNHETFYVAAHAFELIAYILLIINLRYIKNGKKKR